MRQCCMICHHEPTNTFERKAMALTLTRNIKIHFHLYRYEIMSWYYVVILWEFYHCLFWTMQRLFKRPYDIKALNISTAEDAWFSRYRTSKLVITADFPLVLVFIIFWGDSVIMEMFPRRLAAELFQWTFTKSTWIPTWRSNYLKYKREMKSLIHSQTATVQPLKFGNG